MQTAPVVIIPCSSKAAYLHRYAEEDKGWTDEDEARWPVPFWHMDAAMASLLILLTAVDEGLGACFFGIPPQYDGATREAFGIPDDFDPVGAITLGHRRDDEHALGLADVEEAPAPRPSSSTGAAGRPDTRPVTPTSPAVRPGTVNEPPGAPVSDPRVLGSSGRQGSMQIRRLAFAVVPVVAAAGLGGLASRDAAETYGRLSKPTWAPPAAVFGPVWTLLYTGIAVAGWRLYDAGSPRPKRLHLTQLALNAAWPAAFFGAREKSQPGDHRRARRPASRPRSPPPAATTRPRRPC